MLKHIFIILWNQRRKYAVLIIEQMLVFAAMSLSLTILYDAVKSYRTPGNLDTDNVLSFGYMISGEYKPKVSSQSVQSMDVVKEKLEKKPYVEGISESLQFIPYARPTEYYWSDSVTFASGKKVYAHFKGTDEAAERVFRPDITEGRWFRDGEMVDGKYPAVLSEQLVEASGLTDLVGKTVYLRGYAFTVTGIVSGIKEEALKDAPPCIIAPISVLLPSGSTGIHEELAAKIKPGYDEEFANDFYKEFNLAWGLDDATELYFASLDDDKEANMEKTIISVAVTSIPSLFFLLFTVLGTIGVNLMDIKERLREFALRVSCGSTRRNVMFLFLLQNMVITGVSAIPGMVIVLSIYPIEMSLPVLVFTLLLTLLISFMCALYPAIIAVNMNPSELLRQD